MTETKHNIRSVRTRAALRDSVLRLAEERNLSHLTVQDFVRHAGVNRSTFYVYYPDKDTLIVDVLDGLLFDATQSCRDLYDTDDPNAFRFSAAWQDSFFSAIHDHPGLFLQILGDEGDPSFAAKLREINERTLTAIWERTGRYSEHPDIPLAIRARYAAMGIQGIILKWLEMGRIEPAETVSDWVWRIAVGASD